MTETNEQAAQAPKGQFAIQRIFVRDMSFESPLPVGEQNQEQPKITQDLNTKVNKVSDELFEVTLQLTVTVKLGESEDAKTAFLAEVHQAGVFLVKDIPEQHKQQLLLASCPNILFPYARECVDSMAVKGGFPPLQLPHINFDQLLAESVARQKAQAAGQTPETMN